MNISYGEAHELFGVGLSRSQKCGQHPAALLSDLPAVSTRHFSNQAMGVEQGEPTRHFGGVGAPLFGVLSWSEKEQTDVSVSEPLERPLPPVDRGQKLGIGALEGVQCSVATAIPAQGLADFGGLLGQRRGDTGGGQCAQVALIGGSRNLGPPVKVGYASSQRIPGHGGVGASLRGTVDFEVLRIVNRGFGAQDVEAVVELYRVVIDPVLQAHPFSTAAPIADHLSAKAAIKLLTQKAHDLLRAQIEHAVQD